MLDYKDWSWNGEIESIDETRCDGVVEYCYERNNVRVCGGKNGNRWNIASPSTENVENHNDFHNGDYDQGELCPRIQAGDQSNDSTLVQLPAKPPAVSHFDIEAGSLQGAPTINFTILSNTYEDVYVRITVSKDGNSRRYISTKYHYWKMNIVSTNKQYALYWVGKTEDGPDYYGNHGTFNFQIVAIDRGGNVSEQQSIDIHIEWLSGINRIGALKRDGTIYIKEGPLDAQWTFVIEDCQALSLAGNRIGALKRDGTIYIKEGPLDAQWTFVIENCTAIDLTA